MHLPVVIHPFYVIDPSKEEFASNVPSNINDSSQVEPLMHEDMPQLENIEE